MEPKEFKTEIFLNTNILIRPADRDKDQISKYKSVDCRKLKNEKIDS